MTIGCYCTRSYRKFSNPEYKFAFNGVGRSKMTEQRLPDTANEPSSLQQTRAVCLMNVIGNMVDVTMHPPHTSFD